MISFNAQIGHLVVQAKPNYMTVTCKDRDPISGRGTEGHLGSRYINVRARGYSIKDTRYYCSKYTRHKILQLQ